MTTMNDLFTAMQKQAAQKRQGNGVMLNTTKKTTPSGIGQGILNVR